MMVKNEERVLPRCLRSVRPYIDAYLIADTGSTDATKQVIERELAGLPGRVVDHTWHNHGANRNLAMNALRAWLSDREDPCAWALLIDADCTWVPEPGFEWPEDMDQVDSYEVELRYEANRSQGWDNVSIARQVLVRTSHIWHYQQVSHAHLPIYADRTMRFLERVYIAEGADGARQRSADALDKYKRDAEEFERQLARDPGNGRAMFYLAQSFANLERWTDAITWYEKRVLAEGKTVVFAEEAYVAQLRVAQICEYQRSPKETRAAYQKAIRMRPTRAEAPYHYALWEQSQGDDVAALMACNLARTLPEPKGERLWVQTQIYRWRALDTFIQVAHRNGISKDACAEWTRELLARPLLPAEQRPRIEQNLRFYRYKPGDPIYTYPVGLVMATTKAREETAQKVVRGLLRHGVEAMVLHLNGYERVPKWAQGLPANVEVVVHPEDCGPAVRFSKLPETRFVLTVDDDLVYPTDYVARTVAELEAHGPGTVVTWHGSWWEPGEAVLFQNRKCISFGSSSRADEPVRYLGCGASGFHRADLEQLCLEVPEAFAMEDDCWLSLQCARQALAILRPVTSAAGWIGEHTCAAEGLYQKAYAEAFHRRNARLADMVELGWSPCLDAAWSQDLVDRFWRERRTQDPALRASG